MSTSEFDLSVLWCIGEPSAGFAIHVTNHILLLVGVNFSIMCCKQHRNIFIPLLKKLSFKANIFFPTCIAIWPGDMFYLYLFLKRCQYHFWCQIPCSSISSVYKVLFLLLLIVLLSFWFYAWGMLIASIVGFLICGFIHKKEWY